MVFILFIAGFIANAQQDPMYTQYMFNTQTMNPAYAGTWESVSFMVLARQQWIGLKGAPETYTFSMQAPMVISATLTVGPLMARLNSRSLPINSSSCRILPRLAAMVISATG